MDIQISGSSVAIDENPLIQKSEVALTMASAHRMGGVMAFSLRTGGCSPAPLDSLNFSQVQGDSAHNVKRNLDRLTGDISIDPSCIVTCRQVHGNTAEIVDTVPNKPPEADAVITRRTGVFPAVKTADCLPILLLDPVKRVAAAVHAGWRGTVLRITREVLRVMENRFHCNPDDIRAGLGPAINPCCYEVDDAVLEPFRRALPDPDRFITVNGSEESAGKGRKASFRLDLAGTNRFELIAHGVPESHIVTTGLCTACRPELFFSHRRDGARSGRHIAITGWRE